MTPIVKRLLIAAALTAARGRDTSAADVADEPQQAAAALEILTLWSDEHAAPTERPLHAVCWTPADRDFPAQHRERLGRMLLHIQDFYAREMARHGLGQRSFPLARDAEGRVLLHDIRGRHPTSRYGLESGSEIRRECIPQLQQAGIDADESTMAIFCNLATWDEQELRFSHKSPYYAGGSYRSGTAWQLDSPELDVLNLPKSTPMIVDGQYGRISLGKHNSIFIGGMAHELGHAFGLPHVTERPDESVRGVALMGSGNRTYGDEVRGEGRGTFLSFAHALRLASHPLFCRRLEREQRKATASLANLEVHAQGKSIAVSGTIAGEPPVYGVVAYFDPEGHSDYNQTSATAVPGRDGRFALQSDALSPGQAGVLQLVPLHANGDIDREALATMRFSYRVEADGTPDLASIQTRQALEPIVRALRQDAGLARRLAREVQGEQASAIAAALTDPARPQQTPAEYRGESPAQSLTAFKADRAAVGWDRPTFNRIPEASMLLESAGDIYATGIYAHAPARHEYSLGGRWNRFRGKAGVATGHFGSVRFQINGDGRELWHSETIEADKVVSFEVDVTDVAHLELITSPTNDGASSDWALWLDPQLQRSR